MNPVKYKYETPIGEVGDCMYLKKANGERVRINRTRGLSTVSVSTEDARPAHESLVDYFQKEVKKYKESIQASGDNTEDKTTKKD